MPAIISSTPPGEPAAAHEAFDHQCAINLEQLVNLSASARYKTSKKLSRLYTVHCRILTALARARSLIGVRPITLTEKQRSCHANAPADPPKARSHGSPPSITIIPRAVFFNHRQRQHTQNLGRGAVTLRLSATQPRATAALRLLRSDFPGLLAGLTILCPLHIDSRLNRISARIGSLSP